MNSTKVIYLDRFGLKVYDIGSNSPVLEKEIKSLDIDQIKSELTYLNNQSILLLLSDSVSYFYQKIIDPPFKIDNNFKANLLETIKSEIPEDFSNFNWDYKVEKDPENKQKVIIFAPIKKFQLLITEISNQLNIKIETIEIESIASTRDPNPIIGITKKSDIKGKDEDTLNLSVIPQTSPKKSPIKKIILVIIFIAILTSILFFIKTKKTTSKPQSNSIPQITPTQTILPTPTVAIKEWSSLNIMVQNGTSQNGLASKTALIFTTSGVVQVNTGNADNKNYLANKLIFKDTSLKETYHNKFKELLTFKDENITIDNSLENDVIIILGIN